MTKYQKTHASYILRGAVLTAFLTNAAFGSGYIGESETRQKMTNFKACLAQLEASASADRKQVIPRTFAPDGSFRSVHISAPNNGVETTGRRSARYEANVQKQEGYLSQDAMHYRIRGSWRLDIYECKGRNLIHTFSGGYSSEMLEPVETIKP